MGQLYDQLTGLTVTVTSPDGNIKATIKGGRLESARFRPGTYQRYDERGLEHQLARLCTLAYTGYRRGTDKIHADNGMNVRRDPSEAADQAEREYIERVHSITVVGAGPSNLVRFKTAGMMNWRCRIADGTVGWLKEGEFVREGSSAIDEVLTKTADLARLLRDEYFNRELSKELREELIAKLSAE